MNETYKHFKDLFEGESEEETMLRIAVSVYTAMWGLLFLFNAIILSKLITNR